MPSANGVGSAPAASTLAEAHAGALAWHDAHQGLRLLALYRFMTPLFQAATMLFVAEWFHVSVASTAIISMLALELLVAVATVVRLRSGHKVSMLELQLQAVLDIGLFTAMLYLTGGTANPFAPLYVLPIMIVGMALPPRRLWPLVLLTMGCYAVLREFHVELSHPQGDGEVYRLHENGMIINYMLTSAMLVFFSTRLVSALRRHALQAGQAREAQMRNEAVAAIGGLAAGTAHELSSPIGTVAVIAAELRQRYAADPQLQEELQLIESQMLSCKQILARMARAGDVRRAESASGARLDEFVRSTVRCVLSTNSGASIETEFKGAGPPPHIVVEESVRQTLANVLQNAALASPQKVRVVVDWGRDWLDMTVFDIGSGFSDELLATLGKGPVRSCWSKPGMGVGLLLGAQAAQILGGSLEFGNNTTGGACVRLRLPLAAVCIDTEGDSHGAAN